MPSRRIDPDAGWPALAPGPSHVGELQRNRCHPDESIRMLFGPRRKRLVVLVADRTGESLVFDFPPPEVVDAARLDVDAKLVHHGDAIVEPGTGGAIFLERGALHHIAK